MVPGHAAHLGQHGRQVGLRPPMGLCGGARAGGGSPVCCCKQGQPSRGCSSSFEVEMVLKGPLTAGSAQWPAMATLRLPSHGPRQDHNALGPLASLAGVCRKWPRASQPLGWPD